MPQTKSNALKIMLFNFGAAMIFLLAMVVQSMQAYNAGAHTNTLVSVLTALGFAVGIFATGLIASLISFHKGLVFGLLSALLPVIVIVAGTFMLHLNLIVALIVPVIFVILAVVMLNGQADYEDYGEDEDDEYDEDEN